MPIRYTAGYVDSFECPLICYGLSFTIYWGMKMYVWLVTDFKISEGVDRHITGVFFNSFIHIRLFSCVIDTFTYMQVHGYIRNYNFIYRSQIELFRAGIEAATRCAAAVCPTTAPTVQSLVIISNCCRLFIHAQLLNKGPRFVDRANVLTRYWYLSSE